MSETIGKAIAAALVKFQGLVEAIPKTADNPFFKSKYADLAGIWTSIQPTLKACYLGVSNTGSTNGKTVTVRTVVVHGASGETISSEISADAKDASPQAIGSAITYLRRYGISMALGLVTEDDDGEAATEHPKARSQQQVAGEPTKKLGLTPEEEKKRALWELLQAAVNGDPDKQNTVKLMIANEKPGETRFSALTASQCQHVVDECMKVFAKV